MIIALQNFFAPDLFQLCGNLSSFALIMYFVLGLKNLLETVDCGLESSQ